MHRRLLSRAFRRTRGVGWWWNGCRRSRRSPSRACRPLAEARPPSRSGVLSSGAPRRHGSSITWGLRDPVDSEGWGASRITTVTNLLRHSRQFVRGRQALVRAEARYTTVTAPPRQPADRRPPPGPARARILATNDRARSVLRHGDGLTDRDGMLGARAPADQGPTRATGGRLAAGLRRGRWSAASLRLVDFKNFADETPARRPVHRDRGRERERQEQHPRCLSVPARYRPRIQRWRRFSAAGGGPGGQVQWQSVRGALYEVGRVAGTEPGPRFALDARLQLGDASGRYCIAVSRGAGDAGGFRVAREESRATIGLFAGGGEILR